MDRYTHKASLCVCKGNVMVTTWVSNMYHLAAAAGATSSQSGHCLQTLQIPHHWPLVCCSPPPYHSTCYTGILPLSHNWHSLHLMLGRISCECHISRFSTFALYHFGRALVAGSRRLSFTSCRLWKRKQPTVMLDCWLHNNAWEEA